MTKLDKLKEVNLQLGTILKELETRIFIEDIEIIREIAVQEEKPKVVVELK
jgi:hypothetical protein